MSAPALNVMPPPGTVDDGTLGTQAASVPPDQLAAIQQGGAQMLTTLGLPGPPMPPPMPAAAPPVALAPPPPATPAMAPPVPAPSAPAGDDIVSRTRAAGDEGAAATADLARANADQAAAKSEFDQATNAQRAQLASQHQRALATADKEVKAARKAAAAEPWTGLMESRTLGDKMLIGIGLLLGGASFSANHVNQGIQMLDAATKEHEERQRARHKQLFDAATAAAEGKHELTVDQLHELGDLEARRSAMWSAVADKLNAGITAAKGRIDVAAAKEKATAAEEKAMTAQTNAVHAKATARHLEAMTAGEAARQAEIAPNAQSTRTLNAARTVAALRVRPGKGSVAAQAAKDKAQAKIEERTLRDADTGEPLGLVPNARSKDHIAEQLSKVQMYVDAVDKFAEHIKEHGQLYNPFSADWKERESLGANVQAMGRGVKGIQASDAGASLEHSVIGGNGLGTRRAASPDVLRGLAEEAKKGIERRLRSELSPMPGAAASVVPTVARTPEKAGKVEIGSRSTSKGRPIIMTEKGWKLAP